MQERWNNYYHPRFMLCVPRELVDHAFPFLRRLEEQVEKMIEEDKVCEHHARRAGRAGHPLTACLVH